MSKNITYGSKDNYCMCLQNKACIYPIKGNCVSLTCIKTNTTLSQTPETNTSFLLCLSSHQLPSRLVLTCIYSLTSLLTMANCLSQHRMQIPTPINNKYYQFIKNYVTVYKILVKINAHYLKFDPYKIQTITISVDKH